MPSLSILDGWWIEGCIEGVTGWAIAELPSIADLDEDRSPRDAVALYDKLEQAVVPMFYRDRDRFVFYRLPARNTAPAKGWDFFTSLLIPFLVEIASSKSDVISQFSLRGLQCLCRALNRNSTQLYPWRCNYRRTIRLMYDTVQTKPDLAAKLCLSLI